MGLRIGITGASGLIGSAVLSTLNAEGHQAVRLPRPNSTNQPLPSNLDAVVHLAGEPLVPGRWTPEKKAKIRNSRVEGTRLLVNKMAHSETRPRVLVCASATGFYGNRGDELLDEQSPRGIGFLANVVDEWEEAAQQAESFGVRAVSLRFGMILSRSGGALAAMSWPFRLGLGGPIGDGRQYWSWLSIEDAVGVIRYALLEEELTGIVNAVAPDPVRNYEFARILAGQLHRPSLMRVPGWAARLAFGEVADELLLASLRVQPSVLLQNGYPFKQPALAETLRQLLQPPH